MRIFVIDDEECIRDVFKWHLEEYGHEVITAETPSKCSVFNNHDCSNDFPCGHVLFIDYFMPGTNALNFIEAMKKRGCRGAVQNKFIMLDNTTLIDHERASRLGCQIIQKPFNLTEIDRLIEQCWQYIDPDARLASL